MKSHWSFLINIKGDNKVVIDNIKEVLKQLEEISSKNFQKEILERKHNEIDPNWRPPEGDPTLPLNVISEKIVPKKDNNNFQHIRNKLSTQIIALQNEIIRMMYAEKRTRTIRNQKRGRLDPKQFHKIVDKNYKVKKKTTTGREIDAAVTLVLDLSGSMSGSKSDMTQEISTIFGESLKTISDIKLEIIGYRTNHTWRTQECYEYVQHYVFKHFEESWESAKGRLGTYQNCVGGANVDHYSVEYAAHRLMQRPEKNKIMFVICDGLPNGNNGTYGNLLPQCLKHTVKKIKKAKIKLFCWGIVSEAIKDYYAPDCVILESISNLNKMTLKKVAQYILRRT